MDIDEADYLAHYGILRKSGRYPWGSGGNQATRNNMFLDMVEGLRKNEGMSEAEIAKGFGITTTELRAAKSIAKNEQRQALIGQVTRMKDKGMSNVAIGQRLGINESQVRQLLDPSVKDRNQVLHATADMLKRQVDEKRFIDIGTGVEGYAGINGTGISQTKLATAVALLKEEGYTVHHFDMPQVGTGKMTKMKVLAPPGTTKGDVIRGRADIKQIQEFTKDGGRSYLGLKPPLNVDPKRVGVRYAEAGGTDADGVIYVRRGVPDVSLGGSNYAQVRIAVGGTHYLKGMAMYKDDLPPGVDLVFNTNKSNTGNKLDAMKKLKRDKDGNIDKDNPFGAMLKRQIQDDKGNVTSAMNIVYEEGSWDRWDRNMSTQLLAKQGHKLAKEQLDQKYQRLKDEFDEINALTNPTVREKLLQSFADGADSSAVHMKAAAMPGQRSQVILPINSLKDTEIYAPNFNNGDRVVLVRYPHGGIFEIPELTVNNRHPEGRKLLANAKDAVGINAKVAERLSGADFDGDTVLVIPNNKGKIKTAPALEGLKGFDPQRQYKAYEGMKPMSARTKQLEMGLVSNLITDMTIRGASNDELARAVRHSMVVIDGEKHNLNYKQSAIDNGIAALRKKYQSKPDGTAGGASTLISRATSEDRNVLARKPRSAKDGGPIDKATGKRVYENTNESYVNRDGKTVFKKISVEKLALTDDAHTLSSGSPVERVYADHSNRLKGLANEARRIAVNTKPTPYNPSAKTAYATEVASLDSKLRVALRNRPLERQAQVLANSIVAQKRAQYPDMEAPELKKIKAQALAEARARTGAQKQQIEITPKEWTAIQSGAISTNKLTQILNNADLDVVKELATPRTKLLMDGGKVAQARTMMANGYTQSEVAAALGVSLTTLKTGLG